MVLAAQLWLVIARAQASRVLSAWQTDGTTFIVRDDRGWRELVADDGSRAMVHTRVKKVDTLVSGSRYTDGFHLAVALAGAPRHALFIGAGGAIGPRQFAAFYPEVEIDVVDVDARVLSAARHFFHLADGDRLRTHVADGSAFIAAAADLRFDIVVLDAYHGAGFFVEALATEEFFTVVRNKLKPGGVLCVNLVGDARRPCSPACRVASAISRAFAGQCRIFRVPERRHGLGNCIGIAVRGPVTYRWNDLARRARRLDRRVSFAAAIARRRIRFSRTSLGRGTML